MSNENGQEWHTNNLTLDEIEVLGLERRRVRLGSFQEIEEISYQPVADYWLVDLIFDDDQETSYALHAEDFNELWERMRKEREIVIWERSEIKKRITKYIFVYSFPDQPENIHGLGVPAENRKSEGDYVSLRKYNNSSKLL